MAPHEWTPEDKQRLREIYPLMSNREIAKLFGVSKIAIDHKTERLGLKQSQKTYRGRNVACANCGKIVRRSVCTLTHANVFCSRECYYEWRRRHVYGISPELIPSTALAYVCGVLLGDGSCFRSFWGKGHKGQKAFAYIVSLEVTEKAFAQSFLEALQRLGLNPRTYSLKKEGNRRDTHCVKAYSKKFLDWWTRQSVEGFERMFLKDAPLLKEFVRGFFESEGSYYKRDYPNYQTFCHMANTDLNKIKLFERALSVLSFKTKIYAHREHRKDRKEFHYVLWILGGKNAHYRFIQLIKPCIKNHLR